MVEIQSIIEDGLDWFMYDDLYRRDRGSTKKPSWATVNQTLHNKIMIKHTTAVASPCPPLRYTFEALAIWGLQGVCGPYFHRNANKNFVMGYGKEFRSVWKFSFNYVNWSCLKNVKWTILFEIPLSAPWCAGSGPVSARLLTRVVFCICRVGQVLARFWREV